MKTIIDNDERKCRKKRIFSSKNLGEISIQLQNTGNRRQQVRQVVAGCCK